MPKPKVITPPSESITLAEAKLHAKINGSVQDSLVSGWITTARELAEHYANISIGGQELEIALDAFPAGAIKLPRGPVTSIVSVVYIDEDGATQTMSDALYVLDEHSTPQWLLPTYGNEWPATRDVANAVKVRYSAGGGTVPSVVRSAMLLTIASLHENRGDSGKELPPAAKALLAPVRVWGD